MSVLDRRAFLALSFVCVAVAVGSAAVATAVDSLARFDAALAREQPLAMAAEPVEHTAVLSNDEWFGSLRSEQAWGKRRSAAPAAKSAGKGSQIKTAPPQPAPWGLFGGLFEPDPEMTPLPAVKVAPTGTYRTVCVRMCDGYFFPVSFSTTRDRFAADEAKCQNSCSADARLYVYGNPGEEPDAMVDLGGRPYSKLKTAFLYRTAYDAGCKCTAHPWEQEARMKHRVFALEAERKKGNKKVVAELKDLKSAMGKTAKAIETGKRRSPKKGNPATATATATLPAVLPTTLPAPLPGTPAPGSLKVADPALTPPPASRGPRLAEGGKSMQKPMGLGASPPPPSASTGGGDWKRRSLSGGM